MRDAPLCSLCHRILLVHKKGRFETRPTNIAMLAIVVSLSGFSALTQAAEPPVCAWPTLHSMKRSRSMAWRRAGIFANMGSMFNSFISAQTANHLRVKQRDIQVIYTIPAVCLARRRAAWTWRYSAASSIRPKGHCRCAGYSFAGGFKGQEDRRAEHRRRDLVANDAGPGTFRA